MDWLTLLANLCLSPDGDGSVATEDAPVTGDVEEVVDIDFDLEDDTETEPGEEDDTYADQEAGDDGDGDEEGSDDDEKDQDADADDEADADPRDAKIAELEANQKELMLLVEAQTRKELKEDLAPKDDAPPEDRFAKIKETLAKMKPAERDFYKGLTEMVLAEHGLDRVPEKLAEQSAERAQESAAQSFQSWRNENEWLAGSAFDELAPAANESAQKAAEDDVTLAQISLKAAAWDKHLAAQKDSDDSAAKERQRRKNVRNKNKSTTNRDRTKPPVKGKSVESKDSLGPDDDYPDPEGLLARLEDAK